MSERVLTLDRVQATQIPGDGLQLVDRQGGASVFVCYGDIPALVEWLSPPSPATREMLALLDQLIETWTPPNSRAIARERFAPLRAALAAAVPAPPVEWKRLSEEWPEAGTRVWTWHESWDDIGVTTVYEKMLHLPFGPPAVLPDTNITGVWWTPAVPPSPPSLTTCSHCGGSGQEVER